MNELNQCGGLHRRAVSSFDVIMTGWYTHSVLLLFCAMENLDQSENFPHETPKNRLERAIFFIWEVAKVVVFALAIIIPVRYFLIQPFYVKGESMEPNFYEYEYLIINEITYRLQEPQRGDVVVLRNPQEPSQFFIKRVIGLPGEKISVRERHVYINDQSLDESVYLDASVQTTGTRAPVQLADNEYYVLGDNRARSLDSRVFGPVTADEFVGKTWLRAWPLHRLARFAHIPYNL